MAEAPASAGGDTSAASLPLLLMTHLLQPFLVLSMSLVHVSAHLCKACPSPCPPFTAPAHGAHLGFVHASCPPQPWLLTLNRDVFLVAVLLSGLSVLDLANIVALLAQRDVGNGEQQGGIIGVGFEMQLPLHLGGIVVDVLAVEHQRVAFLIV